MKNPQLPADLDTKDCEGGTVKFDLDITAADDSPASKFGTFEGYASVFNNRDSQGEIVAPGAYKDCLENFKENGFVAYGHEWKGLGIGFIKDAYEDDKGLYVKGQFHRHPDAQAVRWAIQDKLEAGKGVKMSIGYKVLEHEKAATGLGRTLKKLDLFEVSLVNLPANKLAHVFSVKDEEGKEPGEALGDAKELAENLEDISSLLVSSTLQKQFEVVLAANAILMARYKSLDELRAKEGRRLSTANRERLSQLRVSAESNRATLLDHIAQIDALLGVGQSANQEGQPPAESLTLTGVPILGGDKSDTKSNLSAEDRRKLPESDFGDPTNRKFPIVDQSDVSDAAHLIGKAADPEAVKRRIITIAKRKGFSLPDAWQADGKAFEDEQRKAKLRQIQIGILSDSFARLLVEE